MSEINSLNDEQTEVVDQSINHDFDLVEEAVETNDGQPDVVDQEAEEPKRQSKEDNHAAKAARLKAEREAKANEDKVRKEAREEADKAIRESGAINPYTNKPFENMEEFLSYGKKVKEAEQKERAENEGKSFEDIVREDEDKDYIRKKRQEDSEKANEEAAENERQTHIKEDIENFIERYPDVDIAELVVNPHFKKFAGSRFEKEPLADLYADYVELVGEAEKIGKAKDTRSSRSTGSGDGAGQVLTAAQKRSLEEWNRANPDMKMSAKEFLAR